MCKRETLHTPAGMPAVNRCFTTQRPLDFIYDRKLNKYDFNRYKNDDKLVQKVRTGKGDKTYLYNGLGKNLFIESFLGGTTPSIPEQDYIYGDNDLTSAKACRFQLRIAAQPTSNGYTERWIRDYLQWIMYQVMIWSEQNEIINVQFSSQEIWEDIVV